MGQPAEISHLQHLSLIWWERGEGRPDLTAPVGQGRLLDHSLRYIFVRGIPKVQDPGSLRSPAKPILATNRVHGPMMNERQEERPERPSGRIEGLRGSPQGQERVVNDLLCQELLPGNSQREAVGGRGVAPVQLVEGSRLPRQEAAMELEIVGVLGVHGPFVSNPRPVHHGRAERSLGFHRMTITVTMYSRARCGLCDEAREVILKERGRAPFEYEEVDIDGDDELELEYGIRIPVVLVNGRERFELTVDPDAFAQALRA